MNQPNYYAVIFTSQRADTEHAAYEEMSQKMLDLEKIQKGFLGVDSVRDASGFGITVSYWATNQDIKNWKSNSEHQIAQEFGREKWYKYFKTRICKVEREYEKDNSS